MRARQVKRTAIIVKPKQPYIQWANSLDDDGVKLGEDFEPEHTVYLIEDIGDYEGNMEAMVAPYFEFIFEEELNEWHRFGERLAGPARSQFDDDEHKEGSEQGIIRLKKVAGPDFRCMVAQESGPGLTSWGDGPQILQIFLDRAPGRSHPQLEQLPANPLRSLQLILPRQPPDPTDRFC